MTCHVLAARISGGVARTNRFRVIPALPPASLHCDYGHTERRRQFRLSQQGVCAMNVRFLRTVSALALIAIARPLPASAQDAERLQAAHRREGNAVTYWNAVADAALTPSQGTNPMAQSRTLAMLHAAIHDAVNAINPRFELYTPGLAAAPGASLEAAVAAAGREVLVTLVHDRAPLVEAAYAQTLAAVPDGAAKAAGIATGVTAAR